MNFGGFVPEGEAPIELPLMAGMRYVVNPGSVGQPRDGDARAAFALYHAGHRDADPPTASPTPSTPRSAASSPPGCPRASPTGWRSGR